MWCFVVLPRPVDILIVSLSVLEAECVCVCNVLWLCFPKCSGGRVCVWYVCVMCGVCDVWCFVILPHPVDVLVVFPRVRRQGVCGVD